MEAHLSENFNEGSFPESVDSSVIQSDCKF